MWKDFVHCNLISSCQGFSFRCDIPLSMVSQGLTIKRMIFSRFSWYIYEYSTVNPDHEPWYGGNALLRYRIGWQVIVQFSIWLPLVEGPGWGISPIPSGFRGEYEGWAKYLTVRLWYHTGPHKQSLIRWGRIRFTIFLPPRGTGSHIQTAGPKPTLCYNVIVEPQHNHGNIRGYPEPQSDWACFFLFTV